MANKIQVKPGDRFGKLTVIKEIEQKISKLGFKDRRVLCVCDCGNETIVSLYELTRKNKSVKSCGCLSNEIASINITKYNSSEERFLRDEQKIKEKLGDKIEYNFYYKRKRNRLYNIWNSMKKRCYYEHSDSYKYYGAKGIKICEEWMIFSNFVDWALNNNYADNLTIDRIDNTKDYCPENCKWSTPTEQANHTSRNRFIKNKNGEIHTVSEWAKKLGIEYNKLYSRLRRKNNEYIEDLILPLNSDNIIA